MKYINKQISIIHKTTYNNNINKIRMIFYNNKNFVKISISRLITKIKFKMLINKEKPYKNKNLKIKTKYFKNIMIKNQSNINYQHLTLLI